MLYRFAECLLDTQLYTLERAGPEYAAGAKGLRGAVLPHRASRPRRLQAGIV
jgi:hypothetical protein